MRALAWCLLISQAAPCAAPPLPEEGGEVRQAAIRRLLRLGAKITTAPRRPAEVHGIDLGGCGLEDEDMALLRHFPRLRVLDLESTRIPDGHLRHLRWLTGLRELHLKDNPEITGDGLRHAGHLEGLRVLSLPRSIGGGSLAHFSRCSELRHLHLGDCVFVEGRHMTHLRGCRKIQRLYLWGTGLNDEGMGWVGRLTDLRVLYLSKTVVTDAGVARLAGCTRLEELSLVQTPVTDAGIAALKPLARLRTFYLEETP